MGSEKITLDDFSEDLKQFSKSIGDFDVSGLINKRQLILDSSLMTGHFRNIGSKTAKPPTDWIYQGQVKGFKAFGIGRIVGSGIGIIEGQFN